MVVGTVSESAFKINQGLKLHVIVGTHKHCKYNIAPSPLYIHLCTFTFAHLPLQVGSILLSHLSFLFQLSSLT